MTRLEERTIAIERPDAPGSALEGVFRPAAGGRPDAGDVSGGTFRDERDGRGAVVAPPHPLYGGSLESPVVNEIAYACARAGIAAVAFNWRGVGASSGEPSGEPEDADADYAAALAHVAASVDGPVVACGYSFGAAAAVRATVRHPRIRRLVLVAPPPSLVAVEAIAAADRPTLVVAGGADRIAPVAALAGLPEAQPKVHVVSLPDADHFFTSGLADVGRAIADWLR